MIFMNTIFNSKSNNNKNDLLFIAHPILFIFFYIILLTITLLYIPKISGAKKYQMNPLQNFKINIIQYM